MGSSNWSDGANAGVGAVTWASGNSGVIGPVSSGNSLIGSSPNDNVGSGVWALSNGNYVVTSPLWDHGGVADVGAATLCDGRHGAVGVVSANNSLIGSSASDSLGDAGVVGFNNGSYVVISPEWANGGVVEAGAVTLRRGNDFTGATITAQNSVRGNVAGGSNTMVFDYDSTRDQLVVGRPAENIVTLFKADLLYRDGFD